ncbi:CHAP domain-containing protein [Streptococcus sciuri]|uniref:CHAP domain-containing protein n=1 Tax=Streptococcus sciuri TaxID=2973939 RepID=A0ABT2F952_9STRE|nr:CHAP domain-containing protein [Streptococcus sciuri]MCS4488954.1 CHAP domain-containing protein [Streptococcus sciuri]
MKKRILSAVLVSGVTLGTATVNANADDYDSQIAAKDAVINNLTSEQAAAQSKVSAIQEQVSSLQAQQANLESENTRLEAVSQQLSGEIQELSTKIVARNEAIKKQARNAQKQSGVSSYLGSILNSKSVSEAITRLVAINKVVSANEKLLEQQENDKATLESKQAENQEAINTVTANKATLEENKNSLATQQAQLEVAQLELSEQLTTAQNEKAELQAQKAAAEEAARQAAQAEAAAKAQAEAEAKAQAEAQASAQSQAQEEIATQQSAPVTSSESKTSEQSTAVTPSAPAQSASTTQATTVQATPVATQSAVSTSTSTSASTAVNKVSTTTSTANTYPVGQCTWGVKSMASWVGNNWGNARDWIASAQAAGHSVGTTPAVGAVAVWPSDAGGYGHVAYVTAVNSATSIQVMESNYSGNMSIGNYRGTFDPTHTWSGSAVYYIYQ